MDKCIIEQYRAIIKEREDLGRRARKLQKQIDIMKKQNVRDKVRGGEGGTTPFTIEGLNDRGYSGKKTALQRSILRMEDLGDKLCEMLDEVETYIAAVPDAERRMIMRYHYQDGYSWSKTARMLGEGYTADAVRVSIKRFLQEEEKKNSEE